MAKLPSLHVDPTLQAIDAAIKEKHDQEPARGYLGMSELGRSCKRASWYSFRFAARSDFPVETIKKFQDGHASEALQADRIRLVDGLQLWTTYEGGEQFGYSDFGDHLSGHMDGVVLGLLQAPKTAHVWEHKSVAENEFAKFKKSIGDFGEKGALKEWKPVYFAQAQLYMGYSKLTRHWITVSTPGGRACISVRTEFDKDIFDSLRARAESIIKATEPPERLSSDPSYYECKWCSHTSHCHGSSAPLMNCRTCVHATPLVDRPGAVWACALARKEVLKGDGCEQHLFIPPMLAFASVVDASENSITYEHKHRAFMFKNGAGGWPSLQLSGLHESMLDDGGLASLVGTFEGSVVVAA